MKWNGPKPLEPSGLTPSFLLFFPLPFLQTPERSRDLLLPFFFFLPFLLALRLLVLGGINSVLGFGDAESIGVRVEDEAVDFRDDKSLRGKGLEIENGVGVRGFDWEGFADLIEVEVGVVDAFAFNFVL